MKRKIILIIVIFVTTWISKEFVDAVEMANQEIQPRVVQQFLEIAKQNNNWKTAFVTGEYEQIVFMSISPLTNPDNEIGIEIHPFDQIIFIVEGNGRAMLNKEFSEVGEGDMIFIPKGISHNVINLNKEKALKIISFYSHTDIPERSIYKKKEDELKDDKNS